MSRAARTCLALAIGAVSTPALSQAVTFADLEGLRVEAKIVRDQLNQRDGKTFSTKVDTDWVFSLGVENAIAVTVRTTSHSRNGTRRDQPQSGTFTLDEPRPINNQGGGDGIWTFADGTLTFIRTFQSGARRVHFAFARGPDGLSCTATFAFARESGGGPIRLQSRFTGRELAIVGSRQLSSTCRVARQDQPPAATERKPR